MVLQPDTFSVSNPEPIPFEERHFSGDKGSVLVIRCNGKAIRIPLKGDGFSIQVMSKDGKVKEVSRDINETVASPGISLEKSSELIEDSVRTCGDAIDSNLFAEQREMLRDSGFVNDEINLSLLKSYNGNCEKVMAHITKNNNKMQRKHDAKQAKYLKKAEKKRKSIERKNETAESLEDGTRSIVVPTKLTEEFNSYQEQLERLIEDGFPHTEKNLKALRKYNGNYELAKMKLSKKKYKKIESKLEKCDTKLQKKQERAASKYEKKKL